MRSNRLRHLTLIATLSVLAACDDDDGPVAPPRDIQITVTANRVEVSWPAVAGTVNYKLLRRENLPPTGSDDAQATVIYNGSARAVTEDMVQFMPDMTGSPHRYYYSVFACDGSGRCHSTVATGNFAPTLVQCLQGGGYTIFWRHASATVCADNLGLGTAATTMVPDWWRACGTACNDTLPRQMNDAGRNESLVIGQQLDRLMVPFGRVLSSEFCRCFTTAQLADLGPAIEQLPELTYYVYDEANRCADTFVLIGQVPAGGTNTAIFGHAGLSGPCGVTASLAWGECGIFKPDGTGAATLITRIPWNGWENL